MPKRICSLPDCENPHRARGLCSGHYNKTRYTEAERHPTHRVACVVCSTTVQRRVHSKYQPTCSVQCRSIVAWGERAATSSGYEWKTDAIKRARSNRCRVIEDFDRVEIFDRDQWTCYLCHIQCDQPDPYNLRAATVDHVIAYANGGQHTKDNARTACLSCNSAKQADAVAA